MIRELRSVVHGTRLLLLALVSFVVFVCLAGCGPSAPPTLIPPMCVTPTGPVPCGTAAP